jgi:hypothetical protein
MCGKDSARRRVGQHSALADAVIETLEARRLLTAIPITNPSFEDPVLSDGATTTPVSLSDSAQSVTNGWSAMIVAAPGNTTATGQAYVDDPLDEWYPWSLPPQGENVGYLSLDNPQAGVAEADAVLTQTLSTTLVSNTTYTLDARAVGGTGTVYGAELWAGGVKLASAYGVDYPAQEPYNSVGLVYTSPSNAPQQGQAIEIRLVAQCWNWVDENYQATSGTMKFDDVTLDAVSHDPPTPTVDLAVTGIDDADEETVGDWIRINSNFDEKNYAPDGRPRHDNEPDASGDRVVFGDDDPQDVTLTIGGQGLTGTWKLEFPNRIKVWKDNGDGTFSKITSDVVQPSIADSATFNFKVEGVALSDTRNDIELKATFIPSGGGSAVVDRARFSVAGVDVDIDSDNDNGFDPPDSDLDEGLLEEEPDRPGKFLSLNDDDTDSDAVPDFADGYNRDGIAGNADDAVSGEQFVPLVLQLAHPLDVEQTVLRLIYSGSSPDEVTGSPLDPGEGSLRIWKKNGATLRDGASVGGEGDYVGPGDYAPADLGITSNEEVLLYVEAVRASTDVASRTIQLFGDPDGPSGPAPFELLDAVLVTAVEDATIIPATPSGLVAWASDATHVHLDWDDNAESGISYKVYRSTTFGFTPDDATNLIQGGVAESLYTDGSVPSGGGVYYYKVKAVAGGVESAPSTQTRIDTTAVSSVPSPTGLAAAGIAPGRIALSWQAPPDGAAYGYRVYRNTTANFTPSGATEVASVSGGVTRYVDSGLSVGTTYYYVVVAVDSTGYSSLPSVQSSALAKNEDADVDNDGIPNEDDSDNDNDEVDDAIDADDDDDGIHDEDDADDIDSDDDGIPDWDDTDHDNDGVADGTDTDNDNDGVPDISDADDDGDGIADDDEAQDADGDNDGISNSNDPDDDNDGIDDEPDDDDDNDGTLDEDDPASGTNDEEGERVTVDFEDVPVGGWPTWLHHQSVSFGGDSAVRVISLSDNPTHAITSFYNYGWSVATPPLSVVFDVPVNGLRFTSPSIGFLGLSATAKVFAGATLLGTESLVFSRGSNNQFDLSRYENVTMIQLLPAWTSILLWDNISFVPTTFGLRVDRNNDGLINADDYPEDDPGQVGKLINVNDDDDNSNDIKDLEETHVRSDDDLATVKVDTAGLPNGARVRLALQSGDQLNVWDKPKSLAGATKLIDGNAPEAARKKEWVVGQDKIPTEVYVEGIVGSSSLGDINLTLSVVGGMPNPPDSDTANLTALNLIIDPTQDPTSEVNPTHTVNGIRNPAAVIKVPAAEASADNAAWIRITSGIPVFLSTDEDADWLGWVVAPQDPGGPGNAEFLRENNNLDNTGRSTRVYGTADGRIKLSVYVRSANGGHIGGALATYEALVVPLREIPYRVQLLHGQTAGVGTNSSAENVTNHIAMANDYLRQLGVKLVPDVNQAPQPNSGSVAVPGYSAIFETTVPDAYVKDIDTATLNDEAANGINYRDKIVNIVYVENIPGKWGTTVIAPGHPDNNITMKYRITEDDLPYDYTMTLHGQTPSIAPNNWGFLIDNGSVPANYRDPQTDGLHFAVTIAHETGHILGLRHRDVLPGNLRDGLDKPVDINLMDVPAALGNWDFDLIQVQAIQTSRAFS